MVDAAINQNGQMITRQIDSPGHGEGSQREFQRAAVQFIKAEEDALSDASIPLSRQQQVRRYFTALRTLIQSESESND